MKNRLLRNPAADSEVWSRYQVLSPGAKWVLQVKSLLVPHVRKDDFQTAAIRHGFVSPDGKPLTIYSLRIHLEELRRNKLLTDGENCLAVLLHRVAVDAVSSPQAPVLVAKLKEAFPPTGIGRHYYAGSGLHSEASRRLIRLNLYANDAEGFAQGLQSFEGIYGHKEAMAALKGFLEGVPDRPEWLATRAPAIRLAFFGEQIEAFLATGVSTPDLPTLIESIREHRHEAAFTPATWPLAYYDLYSGRLDEIKRLLSENITNESGVMERLFAADIAFLENRNDDALRYFREALKLHRKHLGKRRVVLPFFHSMFFVLALFRANDPALQAEIQSYLDLVREAAAPPLAFRALEAVLRVVQGQPAVALEVLTQLRKTPSSEPMFAAIVALAEYIADPKTARKNGAALIEAFAKLANTMPLVARIYAEILAETADDAKQYKHFIRDKTASITLRFTAIVALRPAWERALQSLDLLLGGDTAAAAKDQRKSKRLVWFVDPEQGEVEVAEQSAKGRDGWTDGRPVALKRLHGRDPKLDYLTEADQAVLHAIRMEKSGWNNADVMYYLDSKRALLALVGHPHVFDARQRSVPIELVAYPLELVVTPDKGGYRVALSHTTVDATVFLEQETPTRYRVVEFPAKMLAVQAIVGPRGLTVPEAARDQLVSMVKRNHPALPVRDEIGAVADAAVAGIATPILQCTPYETGLKINIVVRPFGGEGPAYVAGLGGRSVLATIAGRQTRATRDLDAEFAQRKALIEACPTLRDRAGTDAHELIIEDLEGALELLVELAALGNTVVIEWPEGKKWQVNSAFPQNMKLKVARDRDWFSVEGSVALDADQVLEMRYLLERLDRAHGRFIPLDDGRFIALTRQLQSQLQAFAAVSEPHKNGRRVHALGAPALDAVLEQAGDVKTDVAWKRHVANIRNAEGWTPKLPPTLQAELRDYQVDGFVWISRLARWGAGACLADDMGLGKTVQTIAVMLDRAAEGPCLVVAPTSVCPNWEAEIARFAPTLTTHRLSRAADRAALINQLGPTDVLICSYGLLHQEAEALGAKVWQMAVLDEAQAIKNAQSRRAQASASLQAGLRLALSGTPVENDLDELWSLFSFVNPGLLGSREGFQKRFAIPIERDRDPGARQALRTLIRPFLLRRTKAAVLSELPPRTEQTMQIEMSDAERAFYEALRQKALENIAAMDAPKGKRKLQILAEITKLRRACCNPSLIDPGAGVSSGKLTAFLQLVDDLIRNRHRALVFSQFVGHLTLIREALDSRKISYEYLDGSTPSAERERRVAAFQAGGADLFLISLRAGGTGLNLTAADYVVHLDPWWNPAVEDQASDRAHRMGQERPVTIYRLIMQDSIEEQILRLHRDKRDLATDLLEGSETTARLSEEELLDLIRV